jgi:hypothetical protein
MIGVGGELVQDQRVHWRDSGYKQGSVHGLLSEGIHRRVRQLSPTSEARLPHERHNELESGHQSVRMGLWTLTGKED